MKEIDYSQQRLALLVNLGAYLAFYEGCGGNPPERLLEVDRVKKPADRRVLRELEIDIYKAVRAERERLDSLLDAPVTMPMQENNRRGVFRC